MKSYHFTQLKHAANIWFARVATLHLAMLPHKGTPLIFRILNIWGHVWNPFKIQIISI